MSLNDKAAAALKRELVRAFPERGPDDAGHDRLAEALSKPSEPGSWRIGKPYGTRGIEIEETDSSGRCRMVAVVWSSEHANLIESAPKLLEACKALLRMMDGLPWHLRDAAYKAFNERTGGLPGSLPSPISKARAAIAKAEGGAK